MSVLPRMKLTDKISDMWIGHALLAGDLNLCSADLVGSTIYSWNSTGEIGRIGRHLAQKPDVKVTMCVGPMLPDASDFPGGIPAYDL